MEVIHNHLTEAGIQHELLLDIYPNCFIKLQNDRYIDNVSNTEIHLTQYREIIADDEVCVLNPGDPELFEKITQWISHH